VRYQWATASHKGRIRTNNEDSAYPDSAGSAEDVALLVLADGMGGHVAGEVASSIAIDTAVATDGDVAARISAANRAILDRVEHDPTLAGMGTTLTLLEIGPEGRATFAHVGDSRAYLLRNGLLKQVTTDHTIVTEYLRAGRITADQAADHPQRHMLTRALGLITELDVDVIDEKLEPGDRVLLCSDGVTDMITDDEITESLRSAATSEEAVWDLVERSNRAGGHDNVTAIVVDIS
jgi:protein phosphatase